MEVLEEYDREVSSEEDRDMTVERKEAIAAMKVAQWRLRLEIKKEQQQKEQLRVSQSKQVWLLQSPNPVQYVVSPIDV